MSTCERCWELGDSTAEGYAAAVDSVMAVSGAFADVDTFRLPVRVRFMPETEEVELRGRIALHRDGTARVIE